MDIGVMNGMLRVNYPSLPSAHHCHFTESESDSLQSVHCTVQTA